MTWMTSAGGQGRAGGTGARAAGAARGGGRRIDLTTVVLLIIKEVASISIRAGQDTDELPASPLLKPLARRAVQAIDPALYP